MWGAGLGLRVQGKLGAAKGWVVLAGGLVAERGFEQLGGGGGVYGHRAELLVTCGNVLGGQRNGNAMLAGWALTDGALDLRGRWCLVDFEEAAVRKTCSDGGFPAGTRPEDPASAREAR